MTPGPSPSSPSWSKWFALALERWRYIGNDARHNLWASRRQATGQKRILVLRQHNVLGDYNDPFLAWARTTHPEAAARFRLQRVPVRRLDLSDVGLVLTWVQDPVRERFPQVYESLKQVEAAAEVRGIPVVNRPDALSNAIKSRTAELLTAAGLRTPRMLRITDAVSFRRDRGGLAYPLLVREDLAHGGTIHFVASDVDLSRVPIESMRQPIAAEFIDTREADGLYRKYRYVVVGNTGAVRHAILTDHWEARSEARVYTDATRAEELEYLDCLDGSVRDADAFQRAARALDLDVVSFDYGYTREGELIIWEANPSAVFGSNVPPPKLTYQGPAIERLYACLLADSLARCDG